MFWSTPRKKKQRASRRNSSLQPGRRLRFEPLEDRRVLAAGLVDVQIFPLLAPGELNLLGDGSNNEVRISQTVNVGTYRIDGLNGTLLQVNGAGVTMPTVTVNGITGDISVDLLAGNDSFTFDNTYAAGGQDSNVPVNLEIYNDDGSNVNTISDVMVNGDLIVSKNPGSTGYSELHILDTTVIGFTVVDNTGGGSGGDTWTEIDNSWLQGNGGAGPAFILSNAEGKDINDILGNSQFGIGPFPLPPAVLIISNAGGGSRTTFTGASAVAGFGTTTVYGDMIISNATNVPGTLDMVTFNGSNVLGDVLVANGDGDTSVTVNNSTLGSHLVTTSPVIGGPMIVYNDAGFDQFAMTQSSAPWGLLIDNDVAAANSSVWGSVTQITASHIGTSPFCPGIPGFPGTAMVLRGDNGRDLVNISGTHFGGILDLELFAGNNEVNLTSQSSMVGLNLVTLGGNDSVLIDNSTIQVVVYVRLGFGADRFIVTNVDPATEWPSALLGSIDINAEFGVDTTNLSALALGALGFEIFV